MDKALVWFRRDLRDYDHAALYHALKSARQVYCVFIFDTDLLTALTDKADRRVEFIWESVRELKSALQQHGGELIVRTGNPVKLIPLLAQQLQVEAVFCNHDYEPAAIQRDQSVQQSVAQSHIEFHSYKDQVIFEKNEILTKTGTAFSVFTPYKNACLRTLNDFYLKAYPVDRYLGSLAAHPHEPMLDLQSLGFEPTNLQSLKLPTGMSGGVALFEDFSQRIQRYRDTRDFPGIKGPSYLSVHLRFGTVSIRHLARTAWNTGGQGAETWLNELLWRDFYFQILHHHPQVAAGQAFRPEFNQIPFPNDPSLFAAWCEGRTGYPLVDAAMRQLNQTGYMHNRLRMVTASFLVKDLLIDWRWGEQYFAEKLIDFDLSANNGGWQWAASTGCDAQPWFRIFNPVTQSEKFDAEGKFIRKYVPELSQCDNNEIHAPWLIPPLRQQSLNILIGKHYPLPVVDHATRREQVLALYKQASNPDQGIKP
ncbi:DNA photolyase family protein [Methylobacillus gramineus]|uniref:cryptochrome/photolyase family protein n=1 Tax=Methylobacillus gramineus TaxID=755169 RepID=UPI001CFFB170|nr:deoxyribodipyrimidine photo-lyase [Methylobacillus gramineus]MCB5185108.1 DNA photolyase family protein [Methylobacillus gramineus]